MDATTRTLQETLQVDRRFVIPVYQRPYVWEQEPQWEPLWTDIESTATRLAETRQAAYQKGIPASDADRKAAPHFLGAIVLEQHPTPTGDVDMRSVVDGQQRLATLQLLLMGVLDALHEVGVDGPLPARLRKLTRNDPDVVIGDALHKVRPRPAEQDEYLAAVAEEAPPRHDSLFASARAFFAEAALGFLRDEEAPLDPYSEGEAKHQRAALLVATLLGLVKLVVIDLDDVDDAQVIFEALNARSTPLSATDLVKNLLFMKAQAEFHDPEELYPEVWARFDEADEWWREETGVGHAQRARQDWLLGDWLIAQLGRVINVGRLYAEFRQWLDSSGTGPLEALDTLNTYADAYESLHGRLQGATQAERDAFQVINGRLNIAAATPVLLWLLAQPEERLPPQERELAFEAVKSFVVRRMAAKAQTRAYNQAFAEVLKAGKDAEDHPGYAIIRALRRGPHNYAWPTDQDLIEQFRGSRYYGAGGINQRRLRLLLGGVDGLLQAENHKGEPVDIQYEKLQVEHVIPQEWKTYWPVDADGPNEQIVLEQQRQSHVHRIGNLTLASSKLNPSMSNDPWSEKRAQLKEHSHLRLNAHLCQEEEWDEERIEARGEWLAKHVAKVWPGPDAAVWPEATAPPSAETHSDEVGPRLSTPPNQAKAAGDRIGLVADALKVMISDTPGLIKDTNHKNYARFIPEELDFLPKVGTGWADSDRILLFEIVHGNGSLRIKLCLGPGADHVRRTIAEHIKGRSNVFNRAHTPVAPQFWGFHIDQWIPQSDYEAESLEDLLADIRSRLDLFVEKEIPGLVHALIPVRDEL